MEYENKEGALSGDAEIMSVVEALLSGTDEPVAVDPDEDLSVPALPPQAMAETVTADDIGDTDDVIEVLASIKAPKSPARPRNAGGERKDRTTAFADRVALDRVKAMFGDELDGIMEGMRSAPEKVADKVYNALCHVAGRGKLSNFTSGAINALRAGGTIRLAELVALYQGVGYKEGTARSQAYQQMQVLPIIGLAKRDGDTLSWQSGSRFESLLFPEKPEPTDEDVLAEI